MKKSQLSVLLFFFCSIISAQDKYHISKPVLAFSNNVLTIKYDITGCGRNEMVDISAIILNSKGDTLLPVFITGDIGRMIPCGQGKIIEWNIEKDNIKINDNIEVFLKGLRSAPLLAESRPERYSRASIMLSSAVFPGWGQAKASGKKAYLATGGLFLGAVGASVYFAMKTPGLEQDYLKAPDEQRDEMYNKWQKNYDLSKVMAFGAAGIWAGNMIWSAVIPVRTTRNLKVTFIPSENNCFISARWNF